MAESIQAEIRLGPSDGDRQLGEDEFPEIVIPPAGSPQQGRLLIQLWKMLVEARRGNLRVVTEGRRENEPVILRFERIE